MDLNPELLSEIDRLCVGLVVQCMFQCRVHNLNLLKQEASYHTQTRGPWATAVVAGGGGGSGW